jgi:hypothetical protein
MAVLSWTTEVTGFEGIVPKLLYIETNDTFATITTAGYLNPSVEAGMEFTNEAMALVMSTTGPLWLQTALVGANHNLVSPSSSVNVVLPTIANHIATYTNVTGTLSEDAATAINGGNIQAGLSGTAGTLSSFPATAARGSLRIVGANSAGDTVTTITNASQAAARTYTIPDAGAASNFLMTNNATTQTIATGSLALTVGTLTLGSSGHASSLTIFPISAANGSFSIIPLNIAGNFTATLSNANIGQSTVYSLPDAGAATSNIAVTTGATVANNFVMASGVAGQIVDSGVAVAGLQLNASGTISAANFQGMFATPVQLIPAPAAGFGIVVFSAYLELVFATAAPAGGGVIVFQYGNTVHGAGVNTIINGGTTTIAAAFATGAAVNQWTTLENGANIGTTASSTTTALGVFLSNQTAAFTANGGTSSIRYAVNYMIVPMV